MNLGAINTAALVLFGCAGTMAGLGIWRFRRGIRTRATWNFILALLMALLAFIHM